MQVEARGSNRLCMGIVYPSRWYMLVCVASQMPLRARLFSPLLASHLWRACARTAARRAHFNTVSNHTMIGMRLRTLASDRLSVICVGTRAPQLVI